MTNRTRQTAAQFRSPAQYNLARAMNMHGYGIDLSQEAFDAYKLKAMNDRQTEKGKILLRLMNPNTGYKVPEIEIADIPGVSTAFARQFLEMGLVKAIQLAEFNTVVPTELLRYRYFGKVKVAETEKTILRPYSVPYLHKLADGFADIGRDVTQLSPKVLDLLTSNRFDLLDLMQDSSLYEARLHSLNEMDRRQIEQLVGDFRRVSFAPGFVLVSRDSLADFSHCE